MSPVVASATPRTQTFMQTDATALLDRVRGCIIGGAIGDAMGGPFEGHAGPLRFHDHHDWSISDDTQLTLATCESIIETKRISPEHIAARFAQWFRARRLTGLGSSTLKALRDLDAGLHWALAGAKGEMSAGNGAAMRIAPLAFHLDPANLNDRQLIRDVSRITHQNEEAYAGALAIVMAVRSLAFGESTPADLFETVLQNIADSRVSDRLTELNNLSDNLPVAEVGTRFGSSAYVVDSVPLALYAASFIERFPFDVVLQNAIEAGGDTDTVASMTGQIAGSWLGASKIPSTLIDRLPNVHELERVIQKFTDTIVEEESERH